MPQTGNTRDRILDTAEVLLQDLGFNGFSYAHIAERLGIKNAAIHYHFPAKADLGCAVLERYRRRFGAWTARQAERGASPAENLSGYFGISLTYLRQGNKVCPLGVLETEFNTLPEPVREQARALDGEMRRWLSEVLEAGRAAGELRFSGPADSKALVINASLQGALQIARAAGPKAMMDILRQLKTDLEA